MADLIVTNTRYGANLRSAPNENANPPINQRFGTALKLIDETGTKWKHVRVLDGPGTGKTGYVSDRNLTRPRSAAVARLIAAVAHYWDLFDRGNGTETVEPYKSHVLRMWDDLGGGRPPGNRTDHPDWPWSAAGISAFIRRAGGYEGFKFSAGHHAFIKDSILKRDSGSGAAPFWGYRLTEMRPEVGDLVVQWRRVKRDFDWVRNIAATGTTFASHTDVICEIGNGHVWAIGCNNSDSVNRKQYATGPDGHLLATNRVFMLMKNRT